MISINNWKKNQAVSRSHSYCSNQPTHTAITTNIALYHKHYVLDRLKEHSTVALQICAIIIFLCNITRQIKDVQCVKGTYSKQCGLCSGFHCRIRASLQIELNLIIMLLGTWCKIIIMHKWIWMIAQLSRSCWCKIEHLWPGNGIGV